MNRYQKYILTLISTMALSSLVTAQPTGPQEHVPLTLLQIVGRSDSTVHVRVADGAGKFAIVDVIDTLAGPDPGRRLRIDFRDLNLRLLGEAPVVFEKGEEDVLFLHRPDWKRPSAKNADVFELMHGRRGKMNLPAEGAGIYIEAVRRIGIVAKQEPSDQVESLRQAVRTDNPVLREAALAELSRLGVLDPADLPWLIGLLTDPSATLREKSLDQMRIVLKAAASEPTEETRRALESARERARNDGDEKVRAQAVRTLSSWAHHEDVVPDLKAIAAIDPSQLVRYEAQRVLFLWGVPQGSGSP